MKTTALSINNLPEKLKTRVQTICQKENREITKIWFKKKSKNYRSMMEGTEKTGWGYFVKEGEID